MTELAWWEYLIITISAFFGILFLNYLVKVLNDSRLEKRVAALEEKALQNHATQIGTPITTLSIAEPVFIETQFHSAMGQLFSTGNRSRANSAINTPHPPSIPNPPARAPTIKPPSDTTIIIPLHGRPLENALETQPSVQSNPEPLINNLGSIYKDELPAFDVSDSNVDMEDISDVPNNLEHGGEVPQPPAVLESTPQISSDGEENFEQPSGLEISGVKIDIRNVEPENIESIHSELKASKSDIAYDLVTDIPDDGPDGRNESMFDVVKGLAPDVPPKKSIVAVNSVTVSYDKNSKHTMLSKNSTSAVVENETPEPEPSEDNESSVKEWVEGIIEETIKTDNQIPENEL